MLVFYGLGEILPIVHILTFKPEERGGPAVWNSATTGNYEEIQKLPYWEQVVEQQYTYANRISNDLSSLLPERYCQVWYEDLCENHSETISILEISYSKGI